MIEVLQTGQLSEWLAGLRDRQARARILVRIRRLAEGNPGDVRPVGGGVSEMRLSYDPGYRIYYVSRGAQVVLLLRGGDKSTQDADIRAARALAKEI